MSYLSSVMFVLSLAVESSYEGLVWEDEAPLSVEFVDDMIERFRLERELEREMYLPIYALYVCLFVGPSKPSTGSTPFGS